MTFEEAEQIIAQKDPKMLQILRTAVESNVAKVSSSSMKELQRKDQQILIVETLEHALDGKPLEGNAGPALRSLWETFAAKDTPKIRPSQVHAQVEVNTRLLEVLGEAFSAIKKNLEKVEQQIKELKDG